MIRYVAFLDILGFSTIVKNKPLSEILQSLSLIVNPLLVIVANLGQIPKTKNDLLMNLKNPQINIFSFSDTFVLSSHSTNENDFLKIVWATRFLASALFGAQFPVRGAITKGEADFVPHTNHLVGKAVIRAAELEKAQDWFGVIIDPELSDAIAHSADLKPLVVEYAVPFKGENDKTFLKTCRALNWHLNLGIETGVESIFPFCQKPKHIQKMQNTLKFCKWIRDNNFDKEFSKAKFPGFQGFWFGQNPPDHPQSAHEY